MKVGRESKYVVHLRSSLPILLRKGRFIGLESLQIVFFLNKFLVCVMSEVLCQIESEIVLGFVKGGIVCKMRYKYEI